MAVGYVSSSFKELAKAFIQAILPDFHKKIYRFSPFELIERILNDNLCISYLYFCYYFFLFLVLFWIGLTVD